MNELPNCQRIAHVGHNLAYTVGFFRERIQKNIVSPGGLYIFCDHIDDRKKISFYSFDVSDLTRIPKG